MAESWMTASGSNGIPTAFIVTKGKIAWIGHPMEMDEPLAKVAAGNYDLAKAASEYREEKAAEQKLMAVVDKLKKLGRNASDKDRLAVFDEAIAETPSLEKHLGLQKYLLMSQTGDEAASAYGDKLVEGVLKDEAEAQPARLDDRRPRLKREASKRDYKLALKAATRADELTQGENGAILDTLALALFETGDAAKALEAPGEGRQADGRRRRGDEGTAREVPQGRRPRRSPECDPAGGAMVLHRPAIVPVIRPARAGDRRSGAGRRPGSPCGQAASTSARSRSAIARDSAGRAW